MSIVNPAKTSRGRLPHSIGRKCSIGRKKLRQSPAAPAGVTFAGCVPGREAVRPRAVWLLLGFPATACLFSSIAVAQVADQASSSVPTVVITAQHLNEERSRI